MALGGLEDVCLQCLLCKQQKSERVLPRADASSRVYPSALLGAKQRSTCVLWVLEIWFGFRIRFRFTWLFTRHNTHTKSSGFGGKQFGKQTEFNNNAFHAIERDFWLFFGVQSKREQNASIKHEG